MTEAVTTHRPDEVCCRWCGVAVPEPPDGPRWFAGSFGPPTHPRSAGLDVCPACADLNDHAVQIARDLPAEHADALGESPVHRVAEVLRACAVLGSDVPPALWEPASYYLRDSGVLRSLEWAEQYDGGLVTREDSCAAAPWSWVNPDRIRSAFTAAAAEANAVGEPHTLRLAPPLGGGCAFCGLDALDADAQAVYRAGGPDRAARSAWRVKRHGGKRRWVCPACAEVNESTPAKTARAAATAAAGLTAEVERAGDVRLPALPPWYSTDAEPSPEPWAHVGGIAAVRTAVLAALAPPPPPPTVEELAARVERLELLLAGR